MEVYRIAKWDTTFVTSESKRYKNLPWIALPTTFQSNGYQSMIDEFGDDAPAIYGAWCSLIKLASSCTVRGVLASSRGKAFTVSRIARMTYFPESVFVRLLAWAQTEEVGWIEVAESDEIDWSSQEESDSEGSELTALGNAQRSPSTHPGVTQASPSTHPGVTPATPTDTDTDTEHLHNNDTDCARKRRLSVKSSSVDLELAKDAALNQPDSPRIDVRSVSPVLAREEANRILRACQKGNHKVDPSLIWQTAAVALAVDTGLIDELCGKLNQRGTINNATSWINGAMRRACEESGASWRVLRAEVVPAPSVVEV